MDSLSLFILVIVLLLILTAFTSATEMALASVNKNRVKVRAENEKKAKFVLKLIEQYNKNITRIVVLNNIINVLIPTISAVIFVSIFGEYGAIISAIVMTILIVLFGEIIPKIYGKNNAEKHLFMFINIINFILMLVSPLAIIFEKIANLISPLFIKDNEENMVEEEILSIIEESVNEGKIEEEEEELIKNAIEFNDTRVEEIYTPKSSMIIININEDSKVILDTLKKQKYSRIPVYENDTENIVGVLNERDFLLEYIKEDKCDIRPLLRKPIFIPDTMKISKLLPELQLNKNHLAIVLDERATIQGLVTVEDMVEELVGEIWDEHDDVVEDCVEITPTKYEVSGELSINDFNEIFEERNIESEQLEATITGYVIELAEKIPEQGETISDEDFIYTISLKEGNKIEKIIIELKPKETNDE